ncbi:riboflavin kinase [Streptomyces cellulosae]|uniref:riboflavin kinase n=1 Tax=Streptomyces cellulosae TaxID=1968 RepID=UPI00068D5CF5|nr:riboflavin kinase [Streptomyces cellulosae]
MMDSILAGAVLRMPFGVRPRHRRHPDRSVPTQAGLIEGPVEHGDRRGRELGFPTANLVLGDASASDGVWAGLVQLPEGDTYGAAVSVGRRATFYGRDGVRLLEAHLLDFSGDLYGQWLRVSLFHRTRPQRRFSDGEALVKQMHQDIADVRIWLHTNARLRVCDGDADRT